MNEIAVIEIFLQNQLAGTLTHLPDGRNYFAFSQEYLNNPNRATLSLSFKDEFGNLLTDSKATRTRLPPFFSNLLPEGYLREYLASKVQVDPEQEFHLLAALGVDLPGAVRAGPILYPSSKKETIFQHEATSDGRDSEGILHFSLAGVQLKFSGVWENGVGLTIPAHGVGGSWIIKLPSPSFAGVPQNEYAMMQLARKMGIDVPEIKLVPLEKIRGLPKEMAKLGSHAFVIKRFDRDLGNLIHIEDFAQVFGLYPEKKYRGASYGSIARIIWTEIGEEGIKEFIRRFVFNAMIGNGDMHLKNWSLIYPDGRTPKLSPAYDYVSTLPYLPDDLLALNFIHSKEYTSLTMEQFKRFAMKSELPEKLITETVEETVILFAKVFEEAAVDEKLYQIISNHVKKIPIYTSFS